jgi:hypothetical protein
MKKQYLIMLLISLFSISSLYCQEIKLFFENKLRLSDEFGENTTPLYFLTFDTLVVKTDTIPAHNRLIPVRLPDMKNCTDTGFFKEYFTGSGNYAFQRTIAFLVGNYKEETTYIWADFNNNLDFTDDNAKFTISKANPYIYISIPNSKTPEGKFVYKFRKKTYEDSISRNKIRGYYYNDNSAKGFVTTECDYWIGVTRQNILSCDTVIDGKKVQIGIMDWNCNGLYNDIDSVSEDNFSSDRILVGNYGSGIISYKPSAGAVQMLPETLIPINGIVYRLKDIDPAGKDLVMEKTDKTYEILKVGDGLPDLKFNLANGQETSLGEQIVKGKYNLIDIWGFWCKGCVIAIPKLKSLDSLYSGKLNIIGLHDSESNRKTALSTIEKNNLTWTQGFLTAEIEKKLLSSGGFPYYVLIGPHGKILKFDTTIKEVEEILKNSMD